MDIFNTLIFSNLPLFFFFFMLIPKFVEAQLRRMPKGISIKISGSGHHSQIVLNYHFTEIFPPAEFLIYE